MDNYSMNDRERALLIDYLAAPHDSFWSWAEGGEVVTWRDGRTIVFREELAGILDSLASGGLPDLNCLLLLLAATRDNWAEMPGDSGVLEGLRNAGVITTNVDLLRSVIVGLENVNRLPPDVRSSSQGRATLCQTVFENAENRTTPFEAMTIAQAVRHPLDEAVLEANPGPRAHHWLPLGLHTLLNGLRPIDAEKLRVRGLTGLDDVPVADVDVIELPYRERVRALLSDLLGDEEFAGLARLSLDLMAAITVPRRVAEADEQQLGGVSDISNRGPLDRLLLSELAHDDLTLAVRVAVNEALYLRREAPPQSPPRDRTLVLDTGLRAWGLPRLYITAVGLALAAGSDKRSAVHSLRSQAGKLASVDLGTRDGVLDHLAQLNPELDLRDGFGELAKTLADGTHDVGELILVTTTEAFEDWDFQRQLVETLAAPFWLVAVDGDGHLGFYERSSAGWRKLNEVRLDLDRLFVELPTQPIQTKEVREDLPAILGVHPLPLLVPHNIEVKRSWLVEATGVFAIASDNRLTLWDSPRHGPVQIATNIPRGGLWWASRTRERGIVMAVIGHMAPSGLHLLRIDVRQQSCEMYPLRINRGARGVCAHGGALMVIFKDQVQVVSQEDGCVVATHEIPKGLIWSRDRFFCTRGGTWLALSFGGNAPAFEPIVDGNSTAPPLLTMLELPLGEGPIGITKNGDIYDTSHRTVRRCVGANEPQMHLHDVRPDGHVTLYESLRSGFRTTVIDVRKVSVAHFQSHPKSVIPDQGYGDYVTNRTIRRRFTHIFVDADGELTLIGRQKERIVLRVEGHRIVLVHKLQTESPTTEVPRRFSNPTAKEEFGFRLSRVAWPNGSEALLDSRGLLHLRPGVSTIPELSIVLTHDETAAWASDGRVWGGDVLCRRPHRC